jgi:hypothetical protein
MNLPDFVNGCFEGGVSLATFAHVRALLRDKAVKGFSPGAVTFFTAWGLYNLFYYPHLVQWWSLCGGVLIVAANLAQVFLIIKYSRDPL